MNEKISLFIDQELDPSQREELIDQICKEDSARESWQRYHLIGNVIRNEVSDTRSDLSELIKQKLDVEPTVLAPLKIKKSSTVERKDVWKSVGLFAIAASLALVAVVTLTPVEFGRQADQLIATNEALLSNQAIQFSNEFDEMLVEHAEFTASSGLNGLMAYAKLVSDQQLEQ